MADTGIIDEYLLLGVCTVVLVLLLMAGDVERNPGPTGKEGSEQVDKMLPTVNDSSLGEDNLFDVLEEMMPVVNSWKAIGRGLRIDSGHLEMIQKDNPGDSKECLSKMLTCWLKRNYNVEKFGEPTWQAVVKVVARPAAGDDCALALNIAEKHPKPAHLPSFHRKRRREEEGPDEGVKQRKEDKEQHQSTRDIAPQITEQTLFRDQEDSCASKTKLGDIFTSEGGSVSSGPSTSTQRDRSQRPSFGCGCGNCTFLSYIENGCPDPISKTSAFPCLNVSELTCDQKRQLRSRLRVESQEIMFKFQQLFSRVYKSLCEQEVTVDTLVTYLLSLGALDPVYKKSQKPLLQTFFQELRNAGSIEDVLWVIRDYFSFFNYHLIEHIVDGLGTDQDRAELENYKKDFRQYSKRRIYECPPVYGPMSNADHADLVLKLDSAFEKFTVEELENFEYRLTKIFELSSQSVLRLCQVEKGCFQLIFQVPSFVQQEIFPLSSDQESALVAENVITLTCGDYQFPAKKDEEGSEPEVTESVAELNVQVFPTVLTTHSIDSDSAVGVSVITDDKSSSDEEDPLSKELEELDDFERIHQLSSEHQRTENTPALHYAALIGDLERVKYLTNEHKKPLQKDKYGDTALHAAAQGESLDVLKYFVCEKNCNPTCPGHRGRTPLHVATAHAHLDVIKYLITEQQVEPLCHDDDGVTPLHISCESGHLNIVKFLTEEIEKYKPMKDLMPTLTTKNKSTPLHLAVLNGHMDITRFFITDMKCSPHISGQHGSTLLHYAAEQGHLHVMKYLIDEQKCDPSCLDKYKNTPLLCAAYKGHLDVVKFLTLEKKCDPTSTNSVGSTPIHVAVHHGHLDILKSFITDLKCSPTIPQLRNAVEQGHLHIIKYLIDEQGFDPSCSNENKQTLLHRAAFNGHLDIVKFLSLKKHCNMNQRNIWNNLPLHAAAKHGHLQVVQFFVEELKCPPNIRGQHNATPSQMAETMGYHDVVHYLQKF